MSDGGMGTAAGWYHAEGDAPGTARYWDGTGWIGEPQVLETAFSPGQPPPPSGMSPGSNITGLPAGLQLASVGQRMGGRVLDAIITFVVFAIPTLILLFTQIDFDNLIDQFENSANGGAATFDESDLSISWWIGLLPGVGLFLWDWLWVSLKGATPGKMMAGTQIVRADGTPGALGFTYGFRRTWNRLLGVIPSVGMLGGLLGLASLIMLFANDKRRTVMDFSGGTVVVVKPPTYV